MDTATLTATLAREAAALAAAAGRAGWDAPVPGLTWTVRDVLTHTGSVHRWTTGVLRGRVARDEAGGSAAFAPHLPDEGLAAWFGEGADVLVATLARGPVDPAAWTLVPGQPARWFWARRQAHETAVHRVDVEAATGASPAAVSAEFAQDGLDELLTWFVPEPQFAHPHPGTLALLPDDGDAWLVSFGGATTGTARVPARAAAGADAVVRGTSSQLYHWAWNRPSAAVATGDADVVAAWRRVRIAG